MSPDLNALRQLVHTESDTQLFDILHAIYTTEAHTHTRSRAGGKLYIFLSNLPEFRAGNEKYRDLSEVESSDEDSDSPAQKPPKVTKPKYAQVYSLADEANKSADILDNLWAWLFGDGKDGIPRIEKFNPSRPDKGLLLNMLIWLRANRGYLKSQNNEDHYKQSQILSSDVPRKFSGSEEVGTYLESFSNIPSSEFLDFWESCYYDEDNFLKQSVSKAYPGFNCHLYLMLTIFREPRLKQQEVTYFLNKEYGWDISNDTVNRLWKGEKEKDEDGIWTGKWKGKCIQILYKKYQNFLDNEGELIAS